MSKFLILSLFAVLILGCSASSIGKEKEEKLKEALRSTSMSSSTEEVISNMIKSAIGSQLGNLGGNKFELSSLTPGIGKKGNQLASLFTVENGKSLSDAKFTAMMTALSGFFSLLLDCICTLMLDVLYAYGTN